VEAQRAPTGATDKKDEKEEPLEIGAVPTRIVERQPDGNYRIKGSQPFMIGKREYKVIVTGLIRPEDFNDEGVSSQKLLDPQFDVVSIRRNQQ
jgi:flagellar L-ring protein precursor FlgH